jgi:hypothetical protein
MLLDHNLADAFNGLFEFLGTFFILKSIMKLRHDRIVRGIAWQQVAFWTFWGYCNIYYYWAMNSPLSWWAGMLVTIVNTIYVAMLIYFTAEEKRKTEEVVDSEEGGGAVPHPDLEKLQSLLKVGTVGLLQQRK